MQDLVKGLLANGVPIEDLNVVRKHLSLVKGGRLGRLSKAHGIVLVVSDVIGDDLEAIGSAPMFFDRSSFADTHAILNKYGLWDRAPESVRSVVQKGLDGEMEETPKGPSPLIDHFLIGSNLKILRKAKEKAEALGIPARIMSSRLRGEAREVAKAILAIGEEIATTGQPFAPPVLLLFGGETTVTLKGGRDGRPEPGDGPRRPPGVSGEPALSLPQRRDRRDRRPFGRRRRSRRSCKLGKGAGARS